VLLPHVDRLILTRYQNNPRSVPIEQLDAITSELSTIPRHLAPTPVEAWQQAEQATEADSLVCVTGSFFIAAEVRRLILCRE
jgi:dihydrofolate synthase/folylpolyglutamate synthase